MPCRPVAALLLVVALAPALRAAEGLPERAPAEYFTGTPFVAGHIRGRQLFTSPFWAKLTEGAEWWAKVRKEIPLPVPVAGVEEVAFAAYRDLGPEGPRLNFGIAIRLVDPVDPTNIAPEGATPAEVGGLPAWPFDGEKLLMNPGPRTILMGTPAALEQMVEAARTGVSGVADPAMTEALGARNEVQVCWRFPAPDREGLKAQVEQLRSRLAGQPAALGGASAALGATFVMSLGVAVDRVTGRVDLANAEQLLAVQAYLLDANAAAVIGGGLNVLEPTLLAVLDGHSPGITEKLGAGGLDIAWQDKVVTLNVSSDQLLAIVPAMAAIATARPATTESAKQLMAIGRACLIRYGQEQKFPESLQALIDQGLIRPETLHNPMLAEHYPEGDYAYVVHPKMPSEPWRSILAFERLRPDQIPPEGIAVLYCDGHVKRIPLAQFQQEARDTIARMRAENPPAEAPASGD